MPSKIIKRNNLKKICDRLRKRNKTIVFTNGCFDLLHVGHIRYLKKAKSMGDILIVGLNSDRSVRRLKGKGRPLTPLAERGEILGSLEMVNYVVPFSETRPDNLIRLIRPHIHVKGGDYTLKEIPEATLVASLGGKTKIVPLVKGRSTTSLIRKVNTPS